MLAPFPTHSTMSTILTMKKLILPILALAAGAALAADPVTLELTGNDQMQYNKNALEVVTGQEVTIHLKHIGKLPKAAMGHNVVVLKQGTELPAFAAKCAPAAATDYIPQDEESQKLIVAHTEMVGGGEETSVTFTAPEPGVYPYLCTFPGHFAIMQGKLTVKAE